MKNGFIYPFFDDLFSKLYYLNLVEGFKKLATLFNKQKGNKEQNDAYKRIGTDVFIVFKWILLLVFWKFKITHWTITVFVWYLIVTNLYTYFIYHIWDKGALKTDDYLIDRTRRRFLNLMLAVAYSITCFAYLIEVPYVSDFNWGDKLPVTAFHAIQFSFSNSLAANYSVISPKTDDGNLICNLELIITFVFVTIILSRSIPQTNSDK